MKKRFIKTAVLCLIAGLTLNGCSKNEKGDDSGNGNGNGNVSVTGVSLNETAKTLTVGASFTLMATVAPDNATNKTLTWNSSNTAIATVSNGTVSALAAGNAVIIVSTEDGGKTASCSVTVEQEYKIAMTAAATVSKVRMAIGGEETATVDWGDGNIETIELSDIDMDEFEHPYSSSSNSHRITITGEKITMLECSNNSLTDLDISRHTELTGLICIYNNLTSLDVSKNTGLVLLACNWNNLDVAALNALFEQLHSNTISGWSKEIYIGSNPGTDNCDASIAERKGWTIITEIK